MWLRGVKRMGEEKEQERKSAEFIERYQIKEKSRA